MVLRTARWLGGAFLFGVLFVAIPAFLTPEDIINTASAEGRLVLGLPTLAIFTQTLLEFSYRGSEQPGKSGGVGRFGPEEFRGSVVMGAGVSSLFLSLGLVSLLYSLQLPEGTAVGVGLILLGVSFIPALVMAVAVLAFVEGIS